MSKSELNISRWLEAHSDRSAGLFTLSKSAILSNVVGDGDYRLVLLDLKLKNDERSRLKVYKGTLLTSDQILPDISSSVISFYHDRIEPRTPVVGVACNSDLLLYKNNKPFYKFTVPQCPISILESEVWKKFKDEIETKQFSKILDDLKTIPYNILTARSQLLLKLPSQEVEAFILKNLDKELVKTTPIVCMTTLKKTTHDKFSNSCPILATESGIVYFLEPQCFTILHQANVSSTNAIPTILCVTGLFDVEYRLVIATRQNQVCGLKRGWLEGKILFQLTTNIVDMIIIPGDNFIVVGTVDKMLHCYTKKGQRIWSSETVNAITCLCLISLNHLSTHLIAVGLKGGPIHLYHGRHPVDYTSAPDTPSCIVFGQMGQEEHVMVVVTQAGTINFKILKRTADFSSCLPDGHAPPNLQGKPLPLPKRSKLFLEQSLRERENPVEMHQTFQQDLIRLRLTAARNLVQNLSDQSGVGNEKEQIKLSAQVPLIPPSLSYKMETKVEENLNINEVTKTHSANLEKNENENFEAIQTPIQNSKVIRVFVIRKDQIKPILAATINMPPTEIAF